MGEEGPASLALPALTDGLYQAFKTAQYSTHLPFAQLPHPLPVSSVDFPPHAPEGQGCVVSPIALMGKLRHRET